MYVNPHGVAQEYLSEKTPNPLLQELILDHWLWWKKLYVVGYENKMNPYFAVSENFDFLTLFGAKNQIIRSTF